MRQLMARQLSDPAQEILIVKKTLAALGIASTAALTAACGQSTVHHTVSLKRH
jgi:hypothetical protein